MGVICDTLCPTNSIEPVENRDAGRIVSRPQASLSDVRESMSQINVNTGPEVEVESLDRDTIKPAPIDEEAKGILDYSAYIDIEQIEPTLFKIKHKDDSTQDVEVSIEVEEDEETVYWSGLPRSGQLYMRDFDFGTQSKHPFVCLKMMLNQQREQVEGLRPHEEISRNVAEAIQIKKENPALHYKILKTVARGGFGEIFQVQRLTDKKIFALKYVLGVTAAERQLVINESSLIAFLDSNEIIKCVDLYDYNKRIWIFLEYMEDGALTNIILKQNRVYSEEFCRYTLYKTAMGLLKMHSKNVLHRDIKSDNILCDRTGEIKIADLGFSVFLSEQ